MRVKVKVTTIKTSRCIEEAEERVVSVRCRGPRATTDRQQSESGLVSGQGFFAAAGGPGSRALALSLAPVGGESFRVSPPWKVPVIRAL